MEVCGGLRSQITSGVLEYYIHCIALRRLVYVRHAFGFLKVGHRLLYVLFIVVFGLYVLNRNLSWTYAHLLKGKHYRMQKGIFCMAKNLTEVIENIEMDHRKEFWAVTFYRGKISIISYFIFFNFLAIYFLLSSQKTR